MNISTTKINRRIMAALAGEYILSVLCGKENELSRCYLNRVNLLEVLLKPFD